MDIVLLCARLLLAVVFGAAGIAKAADLSGSRRAMVGFGVPEKLAGLVGMGLPFAEILIAFALILLNSAWAGALAASVLLLIFSVAIAANLARGRTPDCHCFGQLHSKPMGWSTLARNLALMASAGLIVVQGKQSAGLSAMNWLGELKTAEIVSLVLSTGAVALVATAVIYLRRVLTQQTTVLAKIEAIKKVIDEDYAEPPVERQEAAAPPEGLPIGAPAAEFSLASIDGAQVTLDDLLMRGKQVLLLFVSPNCSPCETLLRAVKTWERDYDGQLTIALLSKGTLKENQDRMAKYEARTVLLQGESGIAEEYQARWTPAAVLLRRDGRIASHLAYGDEGIRALVTQAITPDAGRKRSLPIKGNGHKPRLIIGTPDALRDLGNPAPSFSLPDMEGNRVRTEDLRGRETLLLFWDPKCPFCEAMSDDIKSLEENPPKNAPRVVFVSSGEEEHVRTESSRFISQFLYDREFDVTPLFGTNATPSAVLIDRDGIIASPPTGGRSEILALAGVRKTAAPVGKSLLS